MPKLADFLEEGLVKRINNLEGRIKGLEQSTCRCGLGPLSNKGGEKETHGDGKAEDGNKKNGADRKDKKKWEGKEFDTEETFREETIGEETIRYAKLEL